MTMKRRKRKDLFRDRDDILSDYCCSFVRGIDTGDTERNPKENIDVESSLTGSELKEFYESISLDTSAHLTTDNPSKKFQSPTNSCNKRIKTEKVVITECVVKGEIKDHARKLINRLLNLSSRGDIKELKEFTETIKYRTDYTEILNGFDQYGWTAIMCTAAEGHLDCVDHLIKEGCSYKGVVENSGRSILDICKQKGRKDVLELINKYDNNEINDSKPKRNSEVIKEDEVSDTIEHDEIVKCKLCGSSYLSSKQKIHEASMIHIFKDNSKVIGTSYEIPDHSVGFQMLLRGGWEANQGLGPEGSGRKNPIKTVFKQDRLGLGFSSKDKKRVSHFSAFDTGAVKRSEEKRVTKKTSIRTYEKKVLKTKAWERNMRHYMSSDF